MHEKYESSININIEAPHRKRLVAAAYCSYLLYQPKVSRAANVTQLLIASQVYSEPRDLLPLGS